MTVVNQTFPTIGWRVGDVLVHTPHAYTHIDYWLDDFLHLFPDKAERIKAYERKKGRLSVCPDRWAPVIIRWLNKNWTEA